MIKLDGKDWENCPECDSLDVSYRFIGVDKNGDMHEGVCRECGASWEDDE